MDTRLRVSIHVEVTWTSVSDFGCRFSTRETLRQGETVSVQLLSMNGKIASSDGPKVFKIMWVSRKPTGMTVGARLQEAEALNRSRSDLETAPSHSPAK